LLTGLNEAGSRAKRGSGKDLALAGPMIETFATVAPTISMQVDMTQAGPHRQMQ
jgi:hypothetical protein